MTTAAAQQDNEPAQAMDLDAVMAGLSFNKDNLSYDSILRLQQLLAEGMKLHDPAQAESMREMLKKMRVSPEQKPSFQFTSPKPPAQAAPDTARGRPVNGATWSPSPLDANAEKEVERTVVCGVRTTLYRKVLAGYAALGTLRKGQAPQTRVGATVQVQKRKAVPRGALPHRRFDQTASRSNFGF